MYNNFDRVGCGISMSNLQVKAYTKTFANNTILLSSNNNPNWSQWGVKSSLNYKSIVNTNTVIGFSTSNTLNIAGILHEDNLTGASVQCNNVSNLPRGFEHKNKNPYMTWRENKMAQCWHGMHATNWGTIAPTYTGNPTLLGLGIGQQGSAGNKSGNQWLGTTWSLSNPQTWVDGLSYAETSPLWVPQSGNESLPNTSQSFGPPNIFQHSYQNPSNKPNANSGISLCPNTNGGSGCPTCRGTDEYDLDSEIANLLLFNSIDLDSLIALNNDTLNAWYEDLEDQIGDLFKIEGFLAQGDFSMAQNYLNNYTPETNVQWNYKTYFQLYKNFASTDSLNYSDSLALLILSSQCPGSDGPAIHKARSLFDLVYGTLTFYNDDSCEASGYTCERFSGSSESLPDKIALQQHETFQIKGRARNRYSIFPNPASTEITIQGSDYRGSATIFVYTIGGNLLFQKDVSFQNASVNIPLNLPNGMYFVRIADLKNGNTSKKLIIAR